MLKKQLRVIIICCLVESSHAVATEQDIYNPHLKDTVTHFIPNEQKEHTSLAIELLEEIDSNSLEDAFVDECPPHVPSKTEKLASLVAPYVIPLLPYVLPCYFSMVSGVEAMKLRAVRYYRALAKRNACQPNTHTKG